MTRGLRIAAVLAVFAAPGALMAQTQSYLISTDADAVLGPLAPDSGTCALFHKGTMCAADGQVLYPATGHTLAEAYGSGEYQELGAGSQVRVAARAWATFGPAGTPTAITAGGSVGAIITWDTHSSGIPAGAPIGIRAVMPYRGKMALGIPIAGARAEVASSLTVFSASEIAVLFEASATYEGTGLFQTRFEATGDWQGDFVAESVTIPGWGSANGFDLDTVDVGEFETVLEDSFTLFYDFSASATVPDGNDHGAMADFSNTGEYTLEAFDPVTGDPLPVTFEIVVCYADCDSAPGAFVLDFFDFLCFQNAFAAGDGYADCDASGALDFFDFLCFQNEFAAGC